VSGHHGRSHSPGGRSAKEREQARLERERRRNEAAGWRSGQEATAAEDAPLALDGLDGEPRPSRSETPNPNGDASEIPRGAGRHLGRRPASVRARAGAIVVLAASILVIGCLVALFQPGHGAGHGRVILTIPKGSSASAIGSILERDGVVSSGLLFDLRALLEGKRGALHSGRFQLERDMSYGAAIDELTKPPPAAIVVEVVIPEGFRRRQIAATAREQGLSGSYLNASRRSDQLDPTQYGAPKNTPNLEGFLFPASYELLAGASASRLVSEQLAAFKERFGPREVSRAHALGLTAYQLLIVASMIEGEAELVKDRSLVAAVIYNRLRAGMPLGIDATLRYALNDYTQPLTEAQLAIDSPYNTRTHRGLPPTPIGNPGLAAIQAAGHPAGAAYLYYVSGADGCGELVFSTTYSQFLQNAAAYNEAVHNNGGRVPRCRK
jgi:UPF0755 protein